MGMSTTAARSAHCESCRVWQFGFNVDTGTFFLSLSPNFSQDLNDGQIKCNLCGLCMKDQSNLCGLDSNQKKMSPVNPSVSNGKICNNIDGVLPC